MSDYPFIQANGYTPAADRRIRLIVIHVMEDPEKPGTALGVAKWFAKGVDGSPGAMKKPASAHYCVDSGAIIQCVQEHDVAWGAPGANRDGIHIEHAGYSAQTPAQWKDDYSMQMLERSSQLAAEIAARWAIPLRWLTIAEVRDRKTMGFCGHIDVTKAFGLSDHTDPGISFPRDDYMALVRDAFGEPFPLETP